MMNLEASRSKERVVSIDVIRGFALLGILLANILFFKSPLFQKQGATVPEPLGEAPFLEQTGHFVIEFFVNGKFYPMFSLLFGLGFYFFYSRIVQRGLDGNSFFKRRMTFLLILGLIHLIFIWSGDILHTYAVAGFFLLLFIDKNPKVILTWGIALLGVSWIVLSLLFFLSSIALTMKGNAMGADIQNNIAAAYQVFSEGTYGEILAFRIQEEVFYVLLNLFLTVPNVLGIFLIGLYFGKQEWFTKAEEYQKKWRNLFIHSFWSGILLTSIYTFLLFDLFPIPYSLAVSLADGLNIIAGPLLMLCYVSFFVLLIQRIKSLKALVPLAAVGRMALTNYLMQSVILVFIFYGFGFGLFGSVNIVESILIAIGIYLLQVVFSTLWLSKRSQGPMEALWRKWTYHQKEQ